MADLTISSVDIISKHWMFSIRHYCSQSQRKKGVDLPCPTRDQVTNKEEQQYMVTMMRRFDNQVVDNKNVTWNTSWIS